MGTEEAGEADSFCPSDEEIEKWMDSAFDMAKDALAERRGAGRMFDGLQR
ncbi:hypothetical protein E3U43_017542 [Larimichthys crocea]|uniref:Uncharacterized protein n=1 Tax=Larimichthys crocea TaxID=215358 RepID=A0ACD3QZL0_LARCR|nr:hypothetical protein E3U43_017542 [Larimichthys crocea]